MIIFALPGVLTSCLLAWALFRLLDQQKEERQAHRIEVDVQRQENANAAKSHREEIAALNQARIEEVANLLQRIQAPDTAIAAHAAVGQEDPPRLDLEDDLEVVENYGKRLDQLMTEMVQ